MAVLKEVGDPKYSRIDEQMNRASSFNLTLAYRKEQCHAPGSVELFSKDVLPISSLSLQKRFGISWAAPLEADRATSRHLTSISRISTKRSKGNAYSAPRSRVEFVASRSEGTIRVRATTYQARR